MTSGRPPPLPLGPAGAGEILTLQRAAYVTEAQAHDDPHLPPLTQGAELREELGHESVWLGSGLLTYAEDQLGDEVTTIELFTGERSAANIRLYGRHGYRETHRSSAAATS